MCSSQKFWYIHSKRCLDYCTYLYSGFLGFSDICAKLSYRIFINNWDQNIECFIACVFFFVSHSDTPLCMDQSSSWYSYLKWLSFTPFLALVNQNNWRDLLLQGFLAVIKNCLKATTVIWGQSQLSLTLAGFPLNDIACLLQFVDLLM